jgi:hypothetical protein
MGTPLVLLSRPVGNAEGAGISAAQAAQKLSPSLSCQFKAHASLPFKLVGSVKGARGGEAVFGKTQGLGPVFSRGAKLQIRILSK